MSDEKSTPDPTQREAVALAERLQKLLAEATKANAHDYYFPWRVIPSDGKPIIAGNRSGNLFRGYIATWQEAGLAVGVINELPAIILALLSASAPVAPAGGYGEGIEAAAKVAECAFDDRPNSRSGHHSEMDWTDGYREGTQAAAKAIRALALTPSAPSEDALEEAVLGEEIRTYERDHETERADNRVCQICDGGPGNECSCLCGFQKWESTPPTAAPAGDVLSGRYSTMLPPDGAQREREWHAVCVELLEIINKGGLSMIDELGRAATSAKLKLDALAAPSGDDAGLLSVWEQAEENHRTYSDTGDRESDIRFLALGLTGEAGEVANFVKKRWRDGDGHDEAIRLEIADVCAYAFMLASTMGMGPADLIGTIAHKKRVFIDKMKARAALSASPAPGEQA